MTLREGVKRETTPSIMAFPELNTIPDNCVGENSLNSMGMVLAFQPGGPGSNPVRTLYFCHAFIHFFLCYELCS